MNLGSEKILNFDSLLKFSLASPAHVESISNLNICMEPGEVFWLKKHSSKISWDPPFQWNSFKIWTMWLYILFIVYHYKRSNKLCSTSHYFKTWHMNLSLPAYGFSTIEATTIYIYIHIPCPVTSGISLVSIQDLARPGRGSLTRSRGRGTDSVGKVHAYQGQRCLKHWI